MNVQEFVDNVSDRIVDYLRDNKTQDMQEVRNIISIHLSHGLLSVLRNEEALSEGIKAAVKILKGE